MFTGKLSSSRNAETKDAEDLDCDAPKLQVFSFEKIKEDTNDFSNAKKLGEGGFGLAYKVKNSLNLDVKYFTSIRARI